MPTRRRLLRVGGVATLGALAGCVDQLRGDGGGGDSAPAYADPLYDPTTIVDGGIRMFSTMDIGTIYEHRGQFPQGIQKAIDRAENQAIGVEVPELDRLTLQTAVKGANGAESAGGGSAILTGSFDADALGGLVESSAGGQRVEEYAGHDLYEGTESEGSEASMAVGISEESLVAGGTGETETTGLELVRATLDADGDGNSDYYRSSDVAGTLMDELETATTVTGIELDPSIVDEAPVEDETARPVVEGLRGFGSGGTIQGETTTVTAVGVYEEGTAPSEDDLETFRQQAREGSTRSLSGLDDLDFSVEGNVARASLERDTTEMFAVGSVSGLPNTGLGLALFAPGFAVIGAFVLDLGSTPTPPPQVRFSFDRRSDGRIEIAHDGGDTIEQALRIGYQHDGEGVVENWRESDGIAAGDLYTTERTADPGTQVRVIWSGESQRSVLDTYTVPN